MQTPSESFTLCLLSLMHASCLFRNVGRSYVIASITYGTLVHVAASCRNLLHWAPLKLFSGSQREYPIARFEFSFSGVARDSALLLWYTVPNVTVPRSAGNYLPVDAV